MSRVEERPDISFAATAAVAAEDQSDQVTALLRESDPRSFQAGEYFGYQAAMIGIDATAGALEAWLDGELYDADYRPHVFIAGAQLGANAHQKEQNQ